ncbi:hypothetical protein [Lysobacter auxotrophicus]|uniref:SMP-30/gluconolactonase/LRE family protein n=1 Tax=Lysobacter auxotrophicus TaxID=2992573 RepID=A0ABN6UJW6_9GAMM|nr:hypothetical protein [Lysobacter auxotrophicus]BDU16597.1 SMP-30/gluconolactonase/LRE family protein [Lysobacter auxotrophicus]
MNKTLAVIALSLACPFAVAQSTDSYVRIDTRPFATLPEDFRHPESLATDPASGEIYVGSFDSREPASARRNQIVRLSPSGKLLARADLGQTPITGLAHAGGAIYFLNFGASKLQRLPAKFATGQLPEDVASFGALTPPAPGDRLVANPDGSQDRIAYGSAGFPAINGLAFDTEGNAYVSDSFQGAIYRIANATACRPCKVDVLVRDPLLATTGALPFGANGIAIDESAALLYVNNAGDGRVLRMPLAGGKPEVLAEGVYGADGLLLHDGLLWAASNQVDNVVALDANGLVRARAGHFDGIGADGAPLGLLFPAATAVQGKRMIVANLALPLTPREGDEWEEKVTRWNLAQFDIPSIDTP